MKRVLALGLLTVCAHLNAITCTSGDWDPDLCNLTIFAGQRCVHAKFFRIYCSKDTVGCGNAGGCVGAIQPGHWYPIVDSGIPKWRCRCGCFAERTRFLTAGGRDLTGTDLMQKTGEGILSRDDLHQPGYDIRTTSDLVYAEDDTVVELSTSNHHIQVSASHPVVIARKNRKLMVRAEDLATGDLLLTRTDTPEPLRKKKTVPHKGYMINFQIDSDDPVNRIILANDLQMGDQGWQDTLHHIGSRLHYRADLASYLAGRHRNDH